MAGGATAGSGRVFRLDPETLPLRYSAILGGDTRRVEATIFLDRENAVIRRPSPAGLPMTLRVPIRIFDGVAVRMTPVGCDGDIEVVVELRHSDPALCLPLAISDDPADVAADWQAWGQALGLQLLLVRQDGTIAATDADSGTVVAQSPKPRRRHSFFANRRPRFLTRRKPGYPGPFKRLAGREIIARD